MLKQDFGFSHAFNYKEADILGELRAGAPSGRIFILKMWVACSWRRPDPYAATWTNPDLRNDCHYNDGDTITPGPRNLTETIYKFVTMSALSSPHSVLAAAIRERYERLIRPVTSNIKRQFLMALTQRPKRSPGLFSGANEGKMLVQLADV